MEEVTGRDHYITIKALAYAIAAIENLQFQKREVNDQSDMKKLLEHLVGSDSALKHIIKEAHQHLSDK
jgi:hypothetical protein